MCKNADNSQIGTIKLIFYPLFLGYRRDEVLHFSFGLGSPIRKRSFWKCIRYTENKRNDRHSPR